MLLENEKGQFKLAAIDMGTNSFHMVISEVLPDGGFIVVDRAKDMIRIGENSITTKMLSEEAMAKGLQSLKTLKKLATERGVDNHHVIAYATSAIREAKNGERFLDMINREVGIKTKLISGVEEARLIYLGVRDAIDIGDKNALMFDIGGGSLEIIFGDGKTPFLLESKKLGVARMLERFVTTDPISTKERHLLQQYYEVNLQSIAEYLKENPPDMFIGSSGTIENIAKMIFNMSGNGEYGRLNNRVFTKKEFSTLVKKVLEMDSSERLELNGLDEKRVDLIVPGLILTCTLFNLFNVDKLMISESALREGMVIDYLLNHVEAYRKTHEYLDVRRKSVIELAQRFQWDKTHSFHVAKLATRLFDQLKSLHKVPDTYRDLLEYAGLLHNIGCFISMTGHHKHSFYIILNGGLRGFSPEEIQIIANTVRYHRKSLPNLKHPNFKSLSVEHRQVIKRLSVFLRLANALDRGHRQTIQDIVVDEHGKMIHLNLRAIKDPEIEVWEFNREKQWLESLYKRKLQIDVELIK